MVRYRRNFVAGGTFFFTVTLADRTSQALTDHITALRTAIRQTRHSRPFAIDAAVVFA
jgi:putative transposase